MSKEGSGVPSRNFRGLRSPGLPLESKLECRPTQKLAQQHPEVAAQMPGILTVCFGSQNYASSQTVFLDLKPFHIFSWTSPWGHLIEMSNSSHWLSSESLACPNTRLTVGAPNGTLSSLNNKLPTFPEHLHTFVSGISGGWNLLAPIAFLENYSSLKNLLHVTFLSLPFLTPPAWSELSENFVQGFS